MAPTQNHKHCHWCSGEVEPIKCWDELMEWREPQGWCAGRKAACVRKLRPRTPSSHPRTLVCHDMKGGYLDDRFVSGCGNKDAYRFYHWSGVDTFVYFSHHLVTVPPPGWINAAHLHGVAVLGTFITEWEDGRDVCKKLLASEDTVDEAVRQLVHIARYHGFEGWLINIENELPKDKIPLMVKFVRDLAEAMREGVKDRRTEEEKDLNEDGDRKTEVEKEDMEQDQSRREREKEYDVEEGDKKMEEKGKEKEEMEQEHSRRQREKEYEVTKREYSGKRTKKEEERDRKITEDDEEEHDGIKMEKNEECKGKETKKEELDNKTTEKEREHDGKRTTEDEELDDKRTEKDEERDGKRDINEEHSDEEMKEERKSQAAKENREHDGKETKDNRELGKRTEKDKERDGKKDTNKEHSDEEMKEEHRGKKTKNDGQSGKRTEVEQLGDKTTEDDDKSRHIEEEKFEGVHRVIWYDSVTKEGKLDWQNELNRNNEDFFNACDGIFLNYTWSEAHLDRTRQAASDRTRDVYVGLDVFGRNFYAGGKYDTWKALEITRKFGLSAAIFAPGWTYETQPDFTKAESRLWGSLAPFLTHRGFQELPFTTSFCQGFGERLYCRGKVEREDPWHDLNDQQPQPLWSQENNEELTGATSVSLVTVDAYNGGGCLGITTQIPITFRLFLCSVEWGGKLRVSVAYKWCSHPTFLALLCHLSGKESSSKSKVLEFTCEKGSERGKDGCEEEEEDEIIKCTVEDSRIENGWSVRKFTANEIPDYMITNISLGLGGDAEIRLGHLAVTNT